MTSITIRAPSDYHVHLRQGHILEEVAPFTARVCGRALVMPNLQPPLATVAGLQEYGRVLWDALDRKGCESLLTFKLLPDMTAELIRSMAAAVPNLVAGKLYPAGATTHSSDGISAQTLHKPWRDDDFCTVLETMQDLDLVLCLHGEMPDQEDPLQREVDFLDVVRWILKTFPRLRVVLEHITTAEAVWFVRSQNSGNLAATITLHHLLIHLGHVCGSASGHFGFGNGKLHPHLFCWPIAKRPSDQRALIEAVRDCDCRFFLGSDSAPHIRQTKECEDCCAGIFSAPVLVAALVDFFEREFHNLSRLENFASGYGDRFYRKKTTSRIINLVKKQWQVPFDCQGIVPFLAGRFLSWEVEEVQN